MIVVEIDLPDHPTIQRHKLAHLDELWNLLAGDPKDYVLEQLVQGRFWRVKKSPQQPQHTEYPQIQGHWFPFDGSFHLSRDSSEIFIQQDPNLSDTTAGTVWDGALLLAHYLPFVPCLPVRATVLELGAGCGLAGMATAVHCKADLLLLTDLPDQLERLHRHVQCNRSLLPKDTIVRPCDWLHPPDDLFPNNIDNQNARIIVLADCVWMKELVPPLFTTMERYLTEHTIVLISYQTRGKGTDELFWKELRRVFSHIQSIPSQEDVCPIPSVFHLLYCTRSKPTTLHRMAEY